jgi:DNA excision repair protein ERCC-2
LCQAQGKERALRLICLNITPHLAKATSKLRGFVCYSATLSPLRAMRDLLGGGEEDACFELPSPFPQEHLQVLQLPVDTRFIARERSLAPVAQAIRYMAQGREGKYIAFFPSYAYMQRVAELLTDLPLHVQQGGMDERERQVYLARFTADSRPLLALAVLGGVFSEGIDLPGLALIGVCVVGVGLPQVNEEREAIRQRASEQGLAGFDVAYRHPGMHKVLQAAGRLIRSEEDRGVLLLCDERFSQSAYRSLLPPHYHPLPLSALEEIPARLQEFWAAPQKTNDRDNYMNEGGEHPD